ncbi:MAG: peptide chain release factor 1 [Victivallales bacterium]|nr:peptide chain release factor 1 [Victivallales bacterium]
MDLSGYITSSEARLQEVERAISAFDFTKGDQNQYQQLNREYQKIKSLMVVWNDYQKVVKSLKENRELMEEADDDLKELVKADIESLEKDEHRLDGEIKALILPMHPNEGKDVIVEIRPGAGGDEAALFVADMYRMYCKYAELKGWKNELMELSDTTLGGIKSVSFTLRGDGAWSNMRFESGVHRVQRIPVTETQGRIHTSTVTVAVLAEAQEVDFELNPEDLRIDVFRASGHGGQCVNTTDSAVRVTHIPTGMFVASQQEKSQHRNKEIAMRILRSRLLQIKQEEEDKKNASERRSQVGTGDRSERIRTYNYPQNRVSDHRFDLTFYDLDNIMEGNMDELIGEIRAIDANRRLAEELGIEA